MKKNKKNSDHNAGSREFTVTMLGQRRTGKSSILASMIDRMNKLGKETNFSFEPDDDTSLLMKSKKSQLQHIFKLHSPGESFDTCSGMEQNVMISPPTNNMLPYRFFIGLNNRPDGDKKKDYTVEFIDIRGEDMAADNSGIIEQIVKSAVIMIAVDAPALMEYTNLKTGFGKKHEVVNDPYLVYNRIVQAHNKLLEQVGGDEEMLPHKLVLLIPTKCEKYYYQHDGMKELNAAVKEGYKNLIKFLENNEAYSVAITPILTLGDVVFECYKTKKTKDGKDVIIEYNEADNDENNAMQGIPLYQMFRFRSEPNDPKFKPSFSPKYCEQPLLYLLAYISAYCRKPQKTAWLDKRGSKLIFIPAYAIAGIPGMLLAYIIMRSQKAMVEISNDKPMMEAIRQVLSQIKIQGDGYQLLYDRLEIGKEI